MMSKEQLDRVEVEFSSAATLAFSKARDCEISLETYTYGDRRSYDPVHRQKLLEAFRDADYEAESRAWILNLIRQAKKEDINVDGPTAG